MKFSREGLLACACGRELVLMGIVNKKMVKIGWGKKWVFIRATKKKRGEKDVEERIQKNGEALSEFQGLILLEKTRQTSHVE